MRTPQKGGGTQNPSHLPHRGTQVAREPAQATFLEAAKTLGGPPDPWKRQENREAGSPQGICCRLSGTAPPSKLKLRHNAHAGTPFIKDTCTIEERQAMCLATATPEVRGPVQPVTLADARTMSGPARHHRKAKNNQQPIEPDD